ncbi:transposable element Tcb1 transposase [Trichonephila clavipes]|nr:transposable element Tcb1 transposase [Trichonephila clavipes]
MEAEWSFRRVARQLGRSDYVVKKTNYFISHHPSTGSTFTKSPCVFSNHSYIWDRVLPLTPIYRRLRLEWCRARGNWTAVEWNHVTFSDESRFNLSGDDNRVCVWRPRGEGLNPVFALQRHTTPTAGVMIWVSLPTIHGHS